MKKFVLLGISAMLLGACGADSDYSADTVSEESASIEQSDRKNIKIALTTDDGTGFNYSSYETTADEDNYMDLVGYTSGADTVYIIYDGTVIDYVETDQDNYFRYYSKTNDTFTTIFLTTDDSLEFGDTVDSSDKISDIPIQVDINPSEDYLANESLSKMPREHRNALEKANSYLEYSGFSSARLREQLEYEEFPQDAIDFAMENIEVDWKEQALKKAESYDEYASMSDARLYDQLIYEGFSDEEAQYAIDNLE
jgi:hypothetical protein